MIKKIYAIIAFLIILFLPSILKSQDLAAFSNFRDNFYVFDGGQFIKLEHLPVQNYKVSKWAVAYQKSNGSLIVYTNGQTHKMSEVVGDYQLTESLMIYQYGGNLYVYDGVEKEKLSMDAPYYKANGEVVAFYDRIDKEFKMYYDGVVYDVESALSNEPVSNYQVGDNILGYLNHNGYLNSFYKGKRSEIMLVQGRPNYRVDKDIIAYYDRNVSAFKVILNSMSHQIDFFPPTSFKTADERVAYVKNDGIFCVFQNGKETTISTISPEFYHVEDSLILYEENGYLKSYYNKRSYTLENYIPSTMKYDFNAVAYLDSQRDLVVFSKGKKEVLSYESVNAFDVYWGVVWFNRGVNTNKIFYNGKVY
jgi:hypothetical protein